MDQVSDLMLSLQNVPVAVTYQNRFPAVYHLSLRTRLMATETETASRGFSVVIDVDTVGIMLLLDKQAGGENVGLGAAFFLTISPFHI